MNCSVRNDAGITKAALAACLVCGVGPLPSHFNTETEPSKEYQR